MINRHYITLVPAYGRDYRSKAAVLADWNSGKDFQDTQTGQYINKEDAIKYGNGAQFSARYKRLTMIVILPTE